MFQRHEGCHCIIEYNNNGTKTYQTSKGGRDSWSDYIKNPQKINDNVEKLNSEEYNNFRHLLNKQPISNKTDHAKQRQLERNIDDRAIEYAKKNAIHISEIYYNENGEPCRNYVGFKITTIVNPDTGAVVTTYRTPASVRKKYKKRK